MYPRNINLRKQFLLAALLAGSVLSTPALAAKSLDLKIEYTGFRLFDLNLNDGITPTIAPGTQFSTGYVRTSAGPSGQGTPGFVSKYEPQGQPVQMALNFATGGMHAAANWDALFQGSESIGGTLNNNQAQGGSIGGEQNFTLSGNTGLQVFVHVSGQSFITSNGETANTVMESNFHSFLRTNDGNVNGYREGSFKQVFFEDGPRGFDQYFVLYTANEYNSTTTGTLFSGLSLSSSYVANPLPNPGPDIPTQPIPEPETYAMLGIGLLTLAAFKRRAAKRA